MENNHIRALPQRKRWIGFDLDHTLIRYDLPPLLEMIDAGYRKFLCKEIPGLLDSSVKAFGGVSFDAVPLDAGFFRRGTVLDFRTGDLISLTKNGSVHTAFHGRRKLSPGEIAQKYPGGKWDLYVSLEGSTVSEQFFLFSEFFTLGVAFGTTLLVEVVDAAVCEALPDYTSIRKYNTQFFQHSFDWKNFSAGSGHFFPNIRRDVNKFVNLRHDVFQMISELQGKGFGVFLCSNSHYDYVHFLMNELIRSGGDSFSPLLESAVADIDSHDFSWIDRFDCAYAFAQKPHFFLDQGNPIYTFDKDRFQRSGLSYLTDALRIHDGSSDTTTETIFIGGKAKNIEHAAETPPIYVGDHLVTDFEASTSIGWHGIAIIEDDDTHNRSIGYHFPDLLDEVGYWNGRINDRSTHVVSDVLHITSIADL